MNVEIDWLSGFGGVLDHGGVDLGLRIAAGSGITYDPEVNRSLFAGNGTGFETVGGVGRGEALVAIVDRVVVTGQRLEPGDGGLELAGVHGSVLEDGIVLTEGRMGAGEDLGCGNLRGEVVDRGSKDDSRSHFLTGEPDDADRVIGSELEIRLA